MGELTVNTKRFSWFSMNVYIEITNACGGNTMKKGEIEMLRQNIMASWQKLLTSTIWNREVVNDATNVCFSLLRYSPSSLSILDQVVASQLSKSKLLKPSRLCLLARSQLWAAWTSDCFLIIFIGRRHRGALNFRLCNDHVMRPHISWLLGKWFLSQVTRFSQILIWHLWFSLQQDSRRK